VTRRRAEASRPRRTWRVLFDLSLLVVPLGHDFRFLEARLRYSAGLLFWNIAIRIEVGEERLLRWRAGAGRRGSLGQRRNALAGASSFQPSELIIGSDPTARSYQLSGQCVIPFARCLSMPKQIETQRSRSMRPLWSGRGQRAARGWRQPPRLTGQRQRQLVPPSWRYSSFVLPLFTRWGPPL